MSNIHVLKMQMYNSTNLKSTFKICKRHSINAGKTYYE